MAIDAAVRRGWTSISEQFVNQDRLKELRAPDGRLRLRVNAYLPVNYQVSKFGHSSAAERSTAPPSASWQQAV